MTHTASYLRVSALRPEVFAGTAAPAVWQQPIGPLNATLWDTSPRLKTPVCRVWEWQQTVWSISSPKQCHYWQTSGHEGSFAKLFKVLFPTPRSKQNKAPGITRSIRGHRSRALSPADFFYISAHVKPVGFIRLPPQGGLCLLESSWEWPANFRSPTCMLWDLATSPAGLVLVMPPFH